MQVDIDRGRWLDPAAADMALEVWAEEFLRLARRLSHSTQETYRRDVRRYILPVFGAHRIGRMPANEIDHWLNDETDQRGWRTDAYADADYGPLNTVARGRIDLTGC